MAFHADAALEDADWTKQTWDFPEYTLDDWRNEPLGNLAQIRRLPVYAAAPDPVKAIFEERLADNPLDE